MALRVRLEGTGQPPKGGRGAHEMWANTPAKPMILCVDDEPDALTILRLFLSAHGFDITVASTAAEALRLVESLRPDLIVTDYAMPDMTGLDLCRALRRRAETRGIPIIMHSGIELRQDHPDLFDRFVLKPTELDFLASEIRALLPTGRPQEFP